MHRTYTAILAATLGATWGVYTLAVVAFADGALGAAYLARGVAVYFALVGAWCFALGAQRASRDAVGARLSLTLLPLLVGLGLAARGEAIFYALALPLGGLYALALYTLGRIASRPLQIALGLYWASQIARGIHALSAPPLETTEALLRWVILERLYCPSELLMEALLEALFEARVGWSALALAGFALALVGGRAALPSRPRSG